MLPKPSILREDVEFESQGTILRGWLYRSGFPGPAVVMAHGLSSVKEMFLDDYAETFAGSGLTALVYDHLGFGASDGEPRQSPDPAIQLQGYRDAVAWVAQLASVDRDRIGIWGSSFSGGQVIMLAAENLPIACAVAQVPSFGVGGPDLPGGFLIEVTRCLESGDLDATLPAVTDASDGVGAMFVDRAYEWFTRAGAVRGPSWRNELHVSGLVALAALRPIDHLEGVRVPLLLIVAPNDRLTPPIPEALAIAADNPLISQIEVRGGHFDVYEAGFKTSSEPALKFFRAHMGF